MADGVDIGALAGRIEFEDHVTATMDLVLQKVDALEDRFGSLGSRVAESAAGFATAEIALKGLEKGLDLVVDVVREMTLEGAKIADVEENFEHLTQSAGRLGSTLLNELREGTHNTITDFELIQQVNRGLTAGMNLTDQQYRVLAESSFALAQATGGDVKDAFDKVNDALLTGRTRSLQVLGIRIDQQKAEEDYAAKLGTTADKLTDAGKLEAARAAILEAMAERMRRLGAQSDGIDEIIDQATTAFKNFTEELGKTIATSPNVMRMFTTIRDAIVDALGGDTQDLVQTFAGWINRAADAVTTYGPVVIQAFVDIKDWVTDVYHTVREGWDTLPDWFKNAAANTALAAGGFLLVSGGIKKVTGDSIDLIGIAGNMTTTLSGLPAAASNVAGAFSLVGGALKALDFTSFGTARISVGLVTESIVGMLGPLGTAGLLAGAFFAAWEIGKTKPVSDFFEKIGLQLQGFSAEEIELTMKSRDAFDAQQKQAAITKAQAEAVERAKELMAQFSGATKDAADQNTAAAAAAERNRLVMEHTAEEIKKMREAQAELKSVTDNWRETVAGLDQDMVKAIKNYLEAGVAQNTLATAYGLTASQLGAITKALKEEQEAAKLEERQRADSQARWSEYYASLRELSGGATDALVADLDRWEAAEIERHQRAKTDTADFYAWLDVQRKLNQEKADKSRLEQDVNSRAFYEKQKVDAQDNYDFALAHSDQFTEEHIENLRRTRDAATQAAEHWRDSIGKELDSEVEKSGLLAKNMLSLGGSFDVTSQNFAEAIHSRNTFNGFGPAQGHFDEGEALKMAKQGYSFDEIVRILEAGGAAAGPIPPPKGPRIPGFADGGVGNFGDGTLAMLHGNEAIIPLNKMGGPGGAVTNHFYVNGTAEESARKIGEILMRQLRMGRQMGTA